MSDINIELLKRALKFYENSPDGQYDLDVVVQVIEREIELMKVSEHSPVYYAKKLLDNLIESKSDEYCLMADLADFVNN